MTSVWLGILYIINMDLVSCHVPVFGKKVSAQL